MVNTQFIFLIAGMPQNSYMEHIPEPDRRNPFPLEVTWGIQ